jgi:hypothetical protein
LPGTHSRGCQIGYVDDHILAVVKWCLLSIPHTRVVTPLPLGFAMGYLDPYWLSSIERVLVVTRGCQIDFTWTSLPGTVF